MLGHEIFGLLGTIVIGTIVLSSFRNGSQTGIVFKDASSGFANLLYAMQGAGQSQAAG